MTQEIDLTRGMVALVDDDDFSERNRTMLLKIFDLVTKMESEIGNGAKVGFSTREGALEIRVDWWEKNYHARRLFTDIELAQVVGDSLILNFFVTWCKSEYVKIDAVK